MRKNKFRGVREKTGEWVYGYLVEREEPYLHDIVFPIGNNSSVTYSVIRRTVGQYTGIRDKAGVEIYELDKVYNEQTGEVGYIAFLQQEAGYVVVYENYDKRLGHRSTGSSYDQDHILEVIGNIARTRRT